MIEDEDRCHRAAADTSPAVVGFNLHFNTLAKAEIIGPFKR